MRDLSSNPISKTGHQWPCTGFYVGSSERDRTDRCTCSKPTDAEVEVAAAVIWHETANDNDPLDYNAIARAALEAARRAR